MPDAFHTAGPAIARAESQTTTRQRLEGGLRDAMRRRDRATVAVLRSVLGAIDNAGAVPLSEAPAAVVGHNGDVPRRELSDADVRAIVHREADERREALATYERLGQEEVATALRGEVAVLESYTSGAT